MPRALSGKQSVNNIGCLIAFLLLFVFVGLAVFTSLFIIPCINVARAGSWTAVPCTINSSTVASSKSKSEVKFYPDVAFTYKVNGQEYTANRFSFFTLKFGNNAEAQSLLAPYPYGAKATCYVDPSHPGNAVLDRTFQPNAWQNLMCLAFVIIPGIGILLAVRSSRASARGLARGQSSWRPKTSVPATGAVVPDAAPTGAVDSNSAPVNLATGEVVLKPTFAPAGASCILIIFALFWNGFIGVFASRFIMDAAKGSGVSIFFALFLIPFVLVGLAIFVAALASVGSLFVPRPVLTAANTSVPLGGSLGLRWETRRGLINPQSLKVTLEAREEATYQRGTDSVTDKNVFLTQTLFESAPGASQSGSVNIQIPADSMHSFEAARNKIVWSIKVKGSVARWPDYEDEYRLVVTPLPRSAGEARTA